MARPPGNIGDGTGNGRDTYGLDLGLSQQLENLLPVAGAATADAVARAVAEARTTKIATGVVDGVDDHRCWVQMDDGGVPGQVDEGFVTCLRMNPGIVDGSRVRVHFDGPAMAEAHGPVAQSPSPAILPTVLFTASQTVPSASVTAATLSIAAESGDFDWEISGTTIFLPSGGFFMLTSFSEFVADGTGFRYFSVNTDSGDLLTGDRGSGDAIFATVVSGAGVLRGAPGTGLRINLFQNSGGGLDVDTRFSLSLVGDEPE